VEPVDRDTRTASIRSSARVSSPRDLTGSHAYHSTSPAADALRAAILAVGAVHMRFRADPNDQAGAWNVVRVAKAKVLGLVRQRIEAQEATNTALEKGDVELILAALLSCTIASVSPLSSTCGSGFPAFH